MQMLPELSERLGSELARAITSLAEPYRSRLLRFLQAQAHANLADLQAGLAGWLNPMRPDGMVDQYNRVRQLIREAEQHLHQEGRI